MALSQSFRTFSVQTIKLAEMNAVPNTEDLRYMLTESSLQRKPVMLPFKNPTNALRFTIKVSPAIGEGGPRWTLERIDGNTQCVVWMRESREVAMIQGKLAIDTISTGARETEESKQESEVTSLTTGFPRHSGNFPAVTPSQENSPAYATDAAEMVPVSSPSFGFTQPSDFSHETSTDWFCSFGALPAKTNSVPKPALFDQKLLAQVVASLTDPKTYLATYGTFCYFLLRQFAQYQITKTGFAVVIFDVSIKQEGEEMEIPQETFRCIAKRIQSLMAPLDIAAHVKDGEFAVLLCSSDAAEAFRFARSIYGSLSSKSILPDGITAEETVVAGAAALPETCHDAGELLAAAREAKEMALMTLRPYVLHPQFSQVQT